MRRSWLYVKLTGCILLFATLKVKDSPPIENKETFFFQVEHLNPLFQNLLQLQKSGTRNINILHIGDSHIQGNFLTDKIRQLFYQDFGLGSKGLVFPFQVAKTNTMAEIRSFSNHLWESKKNTNAIFGEQAGICGRAIINTNPSSSFTLRVAGYNSEYAFDEVSVLYTPLSINSELCVKDSLGNDLLKTKIIKEKGFIAEQYKNFTPIQRIDLNTVGSGQTMVHGVILRNSQKKGITYNVAGVNGSQYKHWALSQSLPQQSALLQPDLIIISLGTNDANDLNLTTQEFKKHVHNLVSNLKKANPDACFILTTPPDSYYKKKYVNPHVNRMRLAIIDYASENQLACWDLYKAMGGANSIRRWVNKGLASKDLIHFTKPGYEQQGKLFYESFIHNYSNHVTNRPE